MHRRRQHGGSVEKAIRDSEGPVVDVLSKMGAAQVGEPVNSQRRKEATAMANKHERPVKTALYTDATAERDPPDSRLHAW